MDIEKSKEIIKSNYPPENYTMLREALDWLLEEVEHLQFENETIRRNRTTQERKDFNRIKQLETANDLLHLENQEYEKALIEIVKTEERLGIVTVSDIAKEALGEEIVEELN
jgi:predicted DNA-binding protein